MPALISFIAVQACVEEISWMTHAPITNLYCLQTHSVCPPCLLFTLQLFTLQFFTLTVHIRNDQGCTAQWMCSITQLLQTGTESSMQSQMSIRSTAELHGFVPGVSKL